MRGMKYASARWGFRQYNSGIQRILRHEQRQIRIDVRNDVGLLFRSDILIPGEIAEGDGTGTRIVL